MSNPLRVPRQGIHYEKTSVPSRYRVYDHGIYIGDVERTGRDWQARLPGEKYACYGFLIRRDAARYLTKEGVAR